MFSIVLWSVAIKQHVFIVLGRQPKATKVFCVNVLTLTTSLILNNIWSNLPLNVKSGSTLNLIFPSHVQAINLLEMHPCPKLQLIGVTFLLVLDHIHPIAALNKPFFLFGTTCLCFRWTCHQPEVGNLSDWLFVCPVFDFIFHFVVCISIYCIVLFLILCVVLYWVVRISFFIFCFIFFKIDWPSRKWVAPTQGVYPTKTTFLTFPMAG